jgi:hypothetical protein
VTGTDWLAHRGGVATIDEPLALAQSGSPLKLNVMPLLFRLDAGPHAKLTVFYWPFAKGISLLLTTFWAWTAAAINRSATICVFILKIIFLSKQSQTTFIVNILTS